MEEIVKLIEMVDSELANHTPGGNEWKELLRERENLEQQRNELMTQIREYKKVSDASKRSNKPSPDTIMQCVTGLAQVVGLAVVGWATRIDREAIRFIKRP